MVWGFEFQSCSTLISVHPPQMRMVFIYCSVPHIRPLFLNPSTSRKCKGAYMRDLTFYLTNTPPLPGPHLDVDIGHYITDC